MTFRPNWQTYKIEKSSRGLRRYRVRSTYIAVNGEGTETHYSFTRKGAQKWLSRLRDKQSGTTWREIE